jgi:tungstate transport system permease protein
MSDSTSALELVLSADPTLLAIIELSLIVSLSAAAFATVIGLPLGALLRSQNSRTGGLP